MITHIARFVIVVEVLIGMQQSRSPVQHPGSGISMHGNPILFYRVSHD